MKTKQFNKSMIIELTILLLCIVVGSYLRMKGAYTNSFAFTYDVGRDLLNLKEIVATHKVPLIGFTTGLPGLFYGPWWYYILLIPFILSSGNPQFIAYFIAASGTLTIILFYFLGKRIQDRTLGLCLAALSAVSPALVAVSAQIWNPNLAPLFLILLLILLYRVQSPMNVHKRIFLYMSIGFLLGLILDMEIVFGTLIIVSVIVLSIIYYISSKHKRNFFPIIINCVSTASGIIITLLPRIIFELRHEFIMTKNLIRVIRTTGGDYNLASSIYKSFDANINLFSFSIANSIFSLTIFIFILLIIGMCILYKKFDKSTRFYIQVCLCLILTFFIAISLFKQDVFGHYLVGLPVIFILFTTLIWKQVYNTVRYKKITILLFLLLIIVNINIPRIMQELRYGEWVGDVSVYRNQLHVVDYIYQDAKGKPFNYVVYTPPVHDYTYQYLFQWYGTKTYGYVPSKSKASLFYLIIEPDKEYPFRINEWLNQRKNDGVFINEIKLPGEIVVQKRIH